MGLLADTFRIRLASFLQAHNPTRVLVGGLPDFLIEQIALAWSSPHRLFLVTSSGSGPWPANVQRCRADDLTAERQHAWTALVSASESRGIQESIRSAGAGTVRELWGTGFPWHRCDLPGVRWIDVRNDFIDRLGLNAVRGDAATCIDQFREELRGDVDAGYRFYGVLDELVNTGIDYQDLCFQLGFPAHQLGRTLRKRGDRESVLARLDEFVDRFKEEVVDDALGQFLDIAQTRYANNAVSLSAVEAALKFFAIEFRHIAPVDAENPVRAWRTVFRANRAHWQTLSADVLTELLEQSDRPLAVNYSLSSGSGVQLFLVGDNQLIVRNRNATAPAVTGTFEFNQNLIDDAGQASVRGAPWRLYSRVNRVFSELVSPLPLGKGPFQYDVPLPTEGKQGIRFVVGPDSVSERAASKKITTLWECCQDYPLIVASAHAKLRAGKRKRSRSENGITRFDIEQEITLPTQGRAALHGYIYGLQGDLDVVLPGEAAPTRVTGITQVPNSPCRQFLLNVEVVEGSELSFVWNDATGTRHRATISFDFKGEAGPRDDSLTGILLRAHGGASGKVLKDCLNAVKSGHQLPPSDLPVKETGKPIALWEVHQQDVKRGWWPILVGEGNDLRDQRLNPNPTGYLFASSALKLNEQANSWRSVVESANSITPIPPEIAAYAEARTKVLGALARQFKLAPEETLDDVNLARRAIIGLVGKQVLREYLEALTVLLRAVKKPEFPSAWRWHAWCVDSVLLFSPNSTGPTAHLLGPFHPITLARLFFVQQCLGERLLDEELSPLAHVFAHVQPLALGHVLDPLLQPVPAMAFSTGEPHWLWLYRQQELSRLPEEKLIDWLRECGLDPQTGPLGVDAEILPQTLKQYILAYPSCQTLRLSLEDCTQRTFEVLRDELFPEEDFDRQIFDEQLDGDDKDVTKTRLTKTLPGGLSVYDPVTKVKRVDGELLSYDSELPLRWHHAEPPSGLSMDLATLPRSNRVDFQLKEGGGACSGPVPVARRGLVEFSSGGLEVATALKTPVTVVDLETATVELLSVFEPLDQQLSWGTSLSMTGDPKANWTICSAGQVDPRLFIEYVRRHPGTALWTYRLFSLGATRTPEFGRGHFLIARVSVSLANSLQTQLAGTGLTVTPNELLTELAQAGLTLGDEFLRTGRTGEGALGQYLVEYLLWQPAGSNSIFPHWTTDSQRAVQSAGFILQVDPFSKVLASLARQASKSEQGDLDSRQRSDLMSIHLQFCGDELWVHPVILESKLLRSGQPDITSALAQAEATANQFDHLLEFCVHDSTKPHEAFWAQPERMLLAELIHLGLRLARGSFSGGPDVWHIFERRVLSKVLSGDFRRDNAQALAIVHSNGPTVNNLASNQPHAFVSFSDANAARTGSVPAAYQSVRQTLAQMLRHACDEGAPLVLLSSPATSIVGTTVPAGRELEPGPVAQPVSPGMPLPEWAAAPSRSASTDIVQAHESFDNAFKDFIGNRQAIERMRDDLVDALIKRPPHLRTAYLFTGNPSTGKTTLANKVAKLLGVTFIKLVGPNIKGAKDFVEAFDKALHGEGRQAKKLPTASQGLAEFEYPESLVFIDEIHLVRADEELLTAFEDKDRYVRLKDRICRFPTTTYIGATTRDSELDRAFRTRFGNPIHLNDYKVPEVTEMLRVKKVEWAAWPEGIRSGLAGLARCIPREAERLAQKLERKMLVSREPLTIDAALEKLRLEEGLDRNGLDQVFWQTLRLLAKQPRPVGRETLAQRLGVVDEEKLVSEIIPGLQALGLVEQGPGGQVITDRGRNYLRNEAPPTTS